MATIHDAVADERNAAVLIYINGELFPRPDAKISVFDSAFLVGDGIWEGLRLHDGELAFLDRHLDRLFGAARATAIEPLMIANGYDRAGIERALRATIDANEMVDDVHVRLMVTRGDKYTPSQHPANGVGRPNVVIIAEHKRANPEVADRVSRCSPPPSAGRRPTRSTSGSTVIRNCTRCSPSSKPPMPAPTRR